MDNKWEPKNKIISRRDFCYRCFRGCIGLTGLSTLYNNNIFASNDYSLKKADYWKSLPENKIKCLLCPNSCMLSSGEDGKCYARGNRNGKFYSLVY